MVRLRTLSAFDCILVKATGRCFATGFLVPWRLCHKARLTKVLSLHVEHLMTDDGE